VTDDHLRCREVVEVLTDYFEGTMPPSERIRLEQHLLLCDGCTNYVEQFRMTIRLTGRLTEEDVAEPVPTGLLEAFRAWQAT
jgi:anti-sigma factor RsiW